jgi:digeranylgeranylglycerophospholipid reductase
VIVVGGGPCGSFAALTAAKLGAANVFVFEEHKEIGVPSHCSGHVSIRGLKRLELSVPQKVIENEIKGAIFYSPYGSEFRVKFGSPITCVLNRNLFDKYLAALAEDAGVKYKLGERVDSFVFSQGFVKGVSTKGNTIASNIVVDSEGCSSILLKKAGLATLAKSMVVNGVQAEVDNIKNIDGDTVEVYLSQNYACGLYAWIIPKRDGSAKVGLATKNGNPRKSLEYFVSHNHKVREKLKNSKLVNLSYHPIPIGGSISKTYENGLLIVGDAASHVKPTTGGGIIIGLTCAKIAGDITRQAIQNRDYSKAFLATYQKRWQKAIGFDMTVMRQIRLMLNRLSDQQIDKIISLCSQLHLDQDLTRVKEIDFQGKGIIPILKNPRTWMVTLYSILASLIVYI